MRKILFIIILTSTFAVNASVIFVDKNATGNNDGSSWFDAYTTINDALGVSLSEDEIHIAQGVYLEGARLNINHSLSLIGGFPSGGGLQDIANNPTIIDGNHAYRVIFDNNSSNNPTFLEGLTIRNGRLNNANGAGIYDNHVSSKLIINSLIVETNTIIVDGSMFYADGAGIYGSNIEIFNSIIKDNIIIGNSGDNNGRGGGVFIKNTGKITNSKIVNNKIQTAFVAFGGGIFLESITILTLINCLVADNLAQEYFVNSSGDAQGGGIYSFGAINIKNSVLWGNNTINDGNGVLQPSELYDRFGLANISTSLIKNQNPSGVDNINAAVMNFDPLFVTVNGDAFHLQADSPLINAGDNSQLPQDVYDLDNDGDTLELIPIDLDGNKRVSNSIVDIGTYEFQEEVFDDGFE